MNLLKTILLIYLSIFSSLVFSQSNSLQLNYSIENNKLSLISDKTKLRTILAMLTLKSGIQTSIHPDADQKISITIKEQPLQKAIERLCLNFNCITYTDIDTKTNDIVITRIEFLPKGKHQSLLLTDTVPLQNEMNIHAKKHQSAKYTQLQKRLELRLNNLPEEIREITSETYTRQIKHYQQKEIERSKRRAERDKDKAERDKFRQSIKDNLKKQNPERFALSEQRRQQLKQ